MKVVSKGFNASHNDKKCKHDACLYHSNMLLKRMSIGKVTIALKVLNITISGHHIRNNAPKEM